MPDRDAVQQIIATFGQTIGMVTSVSTRMDIAVW
jgi:hypothetical protein